MAARRALLDDIAAMNSAHLAEYGDPEIDTRIAQYEMAFRMQTSVPDLVDFSDETQTTLDRYGPDSLHQGTFANNCLIARKLLERGVRFVQLMHSGGISIPTCLRSSNSSASTRKRPLPR